MDIEKLYSVAAECERALEGEFARIDANACACTDKVMEAFRKNRLCDRLFADSFGAEAGFARHSITSGTHALAIGLYALLRPGDTLYSVTGKPYDTLEGIIGIDGRGAGDGNLADYGIKYRQTELGEARTKA